MQERDVVVVGAGAAGLGCAVALVWSRLRVTLVDLPPPRASLVAGGMLGPVSEAAHEADPDRAGLTLQFGLEGLAAWRRFGSALGVAVRPVGALLAQDGETQARAEQLAHQCGWAAHRRGQALFLPDEAVLHPIEAVAAMRAHLQARGAEVVEAREAAAPWSVAGRVCGVSIGERVMRAQAVVLAPGAAAHPAWRAPAPQLDALAPVRGCILRFAGAPDTPAAPAWRGEGLYLVAQPGGVLLAGASMEWGQREAHVDGEIAAQLHAAALRVRPDLAGLAWRAQAGVRALARDGAPLLGPAAPGLFLAAGMGRNGWLFALAAGLRVAAMIRDGGPLRLGQMEREFPP